MRTISITISAGLVVVAAALVLWPHSPPGSPSKGPKEVVDFNTHVLRILSEYQSAPPVRQMRGSEILKSMGTIKDVYVNSRLVARGGIDKGYCSGFVFEVFFRAWGAAQGAQWPTTSALSTRNWRQFQKDFYGVDGNRQTFVNALTSRNMGTKVSIDEAKPGDLVQYWRNNNTGHSGIFKEIVRELDGSPGSLIIFGLNRNGLGNREEIIGTGRSQVNISEIFIVRPTVR